MTELDRVWSQVCQADDAAFAEWMDHVELPLRESLRRFAQAVDVEGVVQETLSRMWLYARDRGRELEGRNASLRYATRMARNMAHNEARRLGREELLPPGDLPEPEVEPEPLPDPALARIIRECLDRLKGKPMEALRARLDRGHLHEDRELAAELGMKRNTFFQNIARARDKVAKCLARHGVSVEEVLQ